MHDRIRSAAGFYGAWALLALLANGCALTTMIQVTPSVGTPGQPLTYTVKVTNGAPCTLTTPELFFLPLIQRNSDIDEICSIAQNPALVLCESVEDPSELPPEVVAACCSDATFAMENPDFCAAATFGNPPQGLKQDIENFVGSHAVTSTALVAAAESTGAAVSCSFNGTFFDCLLDDIPVGQSETVTFTVTPTQGGSFANFAVVGGSVACDSTLAPFGSSCSDTTVTTMAPAPALSSTGLAAALLLLGMIAAWRLRAVHRRRPRRA